MYDFDTLIDRANTGALKWDRRTDEEKRLGYIPMSVADMEFPVAPAIREAVVAAAEKGLYGYTDPEERYFQTVVDFMRRRHDLAVAPEEIVCEYGVVPALCTAIRAFTEPGEGVILQNPVYYPFLESIELNGRQPLDNPLIEREGRYEMDFAGLEALAARPEAKLMLLCSPHNPAGRVWTVEELARVADICGRHGVLVVSDEIHFDIILSGKHTVYANVSEEARRHCLICTAPSKTFNLPGLQLANMLIFDADLRARFKRQLAADGFSNISYFGYAATIAAYRDCDDWLAELLDVLRGNFACFRDFLAENIPEARVTPLEGTYLAWVNFRFLGLEAQELKRFTRGEAKLFLDEGYIFGEHGAGFERFNLALPRRELVKALERLAAAYRARFGR